MNTLQTKLTRLNAQLKITKGDRNKAKIVLEILKLEASIEQLEPKQEIARVEELELIQEKPVEVKKEIDQSKPVDAPVTKKDEFCKKPDRKTIKLLESRFKDAQVNITETQIILKSETSELALNLSSEIPDISDYYNQYRRTKTIKNLKQNQTSKIHSVYEYIGSMLLVA